MRYATLLPSFFFDAGNLIALPFAVFLDEVLFAHFGHSLLPGRKSCPELHHVAVGHDVVLALHAHPAVGAGLGHAPVLHEVVVADDLGLDETALEVGVDDAGGLRGGPPLADRPGPRLLLPRRQVGLEPERVEAHARQLVQPRLGLPALVQHFGGLVGLELDELGLELRVEEHGLGRRHELAQPRPPRLVAHSGVVHVEHVDDGLGGHELEGAQRAVVDPGPGGGARGHGGGQHGALLQDLQRRARGVQHRGVGLPAAHLLLQARDRLLQGLDIGQHELGGDGLDVVGRLDPPVHVHDVGVVEGARDHADGVGLADIGQELVAQALALAGPAHDPGDVDEGDGRGHHPGAVEHLGQLLQAGVGQRDDADVRLDRGEGVVRREDGRTGEGVEKGGLADVGQSDDSDRKGHGASLAAGRAPGRTQVSSVRPAAGRSPQAARRFPQPARR